MRSGLRIICAYRAATGDTAANVNLANGLVQTNRLAEGVARLREALRLEPGNARAPLFDTKRFTRGMESAFATAWSRHLAGAAPPRLAV